MSSSKKTRPIFQMIAGISLNGKITDESGGFEKYSSPEDQAFLQEKIKESDVLIMGRKTFEKHVKTQNKPLIIFSKAKKGIFLDQERNLMTHWFNDSKEELMNLCNVLQYQTITILGGAEIYHWSIEQGIVTDLYLTVEPYVIAKGKHLLEGGLLKRKTTFRLISSKTMNNKGTQLLHYR